MYIQALFLILFFNISPQEKLSDTYFEFIDSNEITTEVAWGFTTHYYSLQNEGQALLRKKVNNPIVYAALGKKSQKASLLYLNKFLKNEEILFFILLLEPEPQDREEIFLEYYSSTGSTTDFYSFNKKAKDGETINYNGSDFHFYHFLAAFYTSNNKLVDETFYRSFIEVWLDKVTYFDNNSSKDFILATLVKSADETDQFEIIAGLYEQLITIKNLPTSKIKRDFYWTIDYSLRRLGEIDKSLEILRKFTIPISDDLGDDELLSLFYTDMGGYLYLLGKYQEAGRVFSSALEQADQLPNAVLTRLYNNLSLIYFNTGESASYIEMQLKALDHAKKQKNYSHQIQIYRNLHIFYRKNRNWDLAKSYIEQASKLAIETGHQSDLVSIYISQAVFEDRYLGNSEEAYEKLSAAKASYNDEVDSRYLIRILVEHADLLRKDQKWSESKNLLEEAKNVAAEYSNSTAFLEILVKLAFIEYNRNQMNDSERLLKEFRAHDVTVVDFPILVLAQTLQAKLFANSGNYGEANNLLASASDLVLERARHTSELETGYWSVEPEYIHLFETYADFLISQNRQNEALVLLDRVKTINDASLVENPLVKASVLTEAELSEERKISEEMDFIRKQLFNTSGSKKLALQNELESLSAQKRELSRNLNETHSREPKKIWKIQRGLKPEQQILHITELNSNYYVSKISRNSVEVKKQPLSAENADIFEKAVTSVVEGRTNLEYLYQAGQFIGIDTLPENTRSVIVMPDGYFHQLPLDIIPVEKPVSPNSYGSAHYFIEQADVRNLNRLRDLIRPVQQSAASYTTDYTGFGISDFQNEDRTRNLVSLPKAPGEVQNISGILSRMNSKTEFINKDATPRQFRNSAGKSRVLHLATHSEISDSDPLFSRLHLSSDPDSGMADYLFAYELFDMNMQNQLVMLNSCESGGDRFLQGSGIMGISRALRYAGAHSLVLNAWSVNDKFAADFAEKFYSFLNEGKSKSRALQLTKIHFIKNKNSNPHYWGPYVLNGDNRPLLAKEEAQTSTYLLAGVFLVGFIALRRDIKKQKSDIAA